MTPFTVKNPMQKVINMVLFKVGCVACVMLASTHHHLWGLLIVALVALVAVRSSDQPKSTLRLIVAASIIGFMWESALSAFGVIEYSFGQLHPASAPLWIVAMWALFATTLGSSMIWLKNNLWLAALFGAIGGPLAFFAGQALGAATIPDTTLATIVLATGWAILTPSLVYLQSHLTQKAHQLVTAQV
jgi:hypothetical protein